MTKWILEESELTGKLPINKIIHGNALTVLKKLPNNSVDAVVTDPPYNISRNTVIRRKGGKFGIAKDISLDFGEWDHNVVTPYDWVPLVYDLLKPHGVLIFFYDKMRISHLAVWLEEEFNMCVRHIGVWVKKNPAPQARKVKWMDATEFFIIATKNHGSGHHYNYKEGQHPDYIITPICQGKERYCHPTQKPEALAEPIIRWWTYPKDIVLDPFCGTGTFLVVALKMGRRFIGIEINKEYCEIALRRIKPYLQQARLTELMEARFDSIRKRLWY